MEPDSSRTLGNLNTQRGEGFKTTVLDYNYINYQHDFQGPMVYPDLADPITVSSNSTSWELGTEVTIIPTDTITSDYFCLYINISNISSNGHYQLHLFSDSFGSGDSGRIGCVAFNKDNFFSSLPSFPFQHRAINANGGLTARLASSPNQPDSIELSVTYFIFE